MSRTLLLLGGSPCAHPHQSCLHFEVLLASQSQPKSRDSPWGRATSHMGFNLENYFPQENYFPGWAWCGFRSWSEGILRGFCPAEAPGTAYCSLGQKDARGIWNFCATPTAGCKQQLPHESHCAGTDTPVGQQGNQEHLSRVVICPVAWLWRGAGITFTFKLSPLLLEAVGLQGPWHSQRGTLLGAERWVLPQPRYPHTSHATTPSGYHGYLGAFPTPPHAQSWDWCPRTPFPVAV